MGVGDSTAVHHCDPVERRMSNVAVTVFVAMSVLGRGGGEGLHDLLVFACGREKTEGEMER